MCAFNEETGPARKPVMLGRFGTTDREAVAAARIEFLASVRACLPKRTPHLDPAKWTFTTMDVECRKDHAFLHIHGAAKLFQMPDAFGEFVRQISSVPAGRILVHWAPRRYGTDLAEKGPRKWRRYASRKTGDDAMLVRGGRVRKPGVIVLLTQEDRARLPRELRAHAPHLLP